MVCSDKTGTLTENQMTVRTVATAEVVYEVSGSGYAPEGGVVDGSGHPVDLDHDLALRWTLVGGAACNDARLVVGDGSWQVVGDPTEGAMLVAAGKVGIDAEWVKQHLPRIATIPFSSERKLMATRHRETETSHRIFVKGAVERILDRCAVAVGADGSTSPLDAIAVLDAAERLATQGLRVLATATSPAEPDAPFDADHLGHELAFTGLQAMLDPPRPAATTAVASCQTAGITVKMITGDHATTAAAIAIQLGILADDDDGAVLTGVELAAIAPEDLPDAVDGAAVFARVSPEQKLRLVEALQSRGHVVAMTGDGVNDAPALQQSDIGIAMGAGGTEVAKEAADMVLTDDDFATIEAAVEEGRGVFDNLTKFITWTLPTNAGEGFVILVAILLGTTLPIIPVQILWINMTTAVALGLMLAFEPKEDDIMLRPPREPTQPILTATLLFRIALVSALLVGGSWSLFEWEQANGASTAEARTAALNLFVVVEAFYLFNCRSLTHSIWHIGVLTNRWILGGVAVQAVGQVAITYLPAMNSIFRTAPIDTGAWARIFAIGALASLVVAADKRRRRRAI